MHLHYQERELKRMKRHLQREDEKIFQRIHVSPIRYSRRNKRSSLRPYVLGQGKLPKKTTIPGRECKRMNRILIPFLQNIKE